MEGPLYRHLDGRNYAVGLREDRLLWRDCGYQIMGSVTFVCGRFEDARKHGVRELSIAWHLLTDVEWEEAY